MVQYFQTQRCLRRTSEFYHPVYSPLQTTIRSSIVINMQVLDSPVIYKSWSQLIFFHIVPDHQHQQREPYETRSSEKQLDGDGFFFFAWIFMSHPDLLAMTKFAALHYHLQSPGEMILYPQNHCGTRVKIILNWKSRWGFSLFPLFLVDNLVVGVFLGVQVEVVR